MDSATNYDGRCIRVRARNQVQIPAFGEWNFIQQDSIPITHYFDCYTTTTPHASVYPYPIYGYYDVAAVDDDVFHGQHYHASPQHQPYFYNTQFQLFPQTLNNKQVKRECGTRRRQQRRSSLENRKRVFDVTSTEVEVRPNDAVSAIAEMDKFHNVEKRSNAKAKDEDLYKIPPELIRKSKPRKKMNKFFNKCFVTICAS